VFVVGMLTAASAAVTSPAMLAAVAAASVAVSVAVFVAASVSISAAVSVAVAIPITSSVTSPVSFMAVLLSATPAVRPRLVGVFLRLLACTAGICRATLFCFARAGLLCDFRCAGVVRRVRCTFTCVVRARPFLAFVLWGAAICVSTN